MLPALARAREAARRASCANNLKQWGVIFKMYASENRGNKYPSHGMYYGPVVDCTTAPFLEVGVEYIDVGGPRFQAVYPEYLTDIRIYRCPSSAGDDTSEQTNSAGDDITTQFCSDESSQALGYEGPTEDGGEWANMLSP